MKTFGINLLVVLAAVLFAFPTAGDEKHAAKEGKNAGFEKIKALAGEWEVAKGPAESGAHGGTVTFKVTAGGSAVLETMFGGTDHEMITLYYLNGDELELTHYCMLQNRPQMKADKKSPPNKISFKCPDKENDKLAAEDHMHAAVFQFVDADHLKTEWTLYKEGKPDSTHSFELTRKKK